TRGFAAPSDPGTAVCVLPGTELAFNSEIAVYGAAAPTPTKPPFFRKSILNHRLSHHIPPNRPIGQTLLLPSCSEAKKPPCCSCRQNRRTTKRRGLRNALPLPGNAASYSLGPTE